MDTVLTRTEQGQRHTTSEFGIPFFVEWNSLLLSHYFPPSLEGEETWLQTTKAELDAIGLQLGGAEGLIAAVREGPPWLQNYHNIAEAAGCLARQRLIGECRSTNYIDPGTVDETYRSTAAPAYLPYLALWVMASSESAEGFYAAVERLSNRPFPTTNQSIRNEMRFVWKDLEKWTHDSQGKFGSFAVRVLGEHQYVGMPRSQCLISPKDKKGFPHLFSECGLRAKQQLNEITFKQVASIAANAYYLSKGLQEAVQNPAYSDPLKRMINASLLIWDGKKPRIRSGTTGISPEQQLDEDENEEVSVVLRPHQDSLDGWDIHWRVPAIGYSKWLDLSTEGFAWRASAEEAGTHALSLSGNPQQACQVLASALDRDIDFTVSYVEAGDDNGINIRKMTLPKRSIRTLVWDAPDPVFGEELIESEIPLTGPCYLLFHSRCRKILARELSESPAKWELMETASLPNEWMFGCILRSEYLTLEQRTLISDSQSLFLEKARIRFVGGRPILRGGGKAYAYYDLPIIEIEAPSNALLAAKGLTFSETTPANVGNVKIGIRRFALTILDNSRALFQIHVLENETILASASLKISIPSGLGVASVRDFGIGPLGRPASGGNRLLGVLQGEDRRAIQGDKLTFSFPALGKWKKLQGPEDFLPVTNSIACKFLDTLAQLGSISFGSARDQVQRLAHQANMDVSPALLILDLRARGHLEVESDSHGHMVRVHAVPPTLYSLPAQRDGRAIRSFCGTFRLQSLLDMGGYLDAEYLIDQGSPNLPRLFLVPSNEKDYQDLIEIMEFQDAVMPADALADWAGGIDDARLGLTSWSWETLATEIRHLQRFYANSAQFRQQSEKRLSVDRSLGTELFRFEDPTVQGLQVYVLGTLRQDGQRQFSFLQDSRWGIWLAMNSFANYVRDVHKVDGVVPWPIHYFADDGTIWLPARMRPPFVIERILVLCSACCPIAFDPDNLGASWRERLSSVYSEMHVGTWLAYRWVPEDIASKVASLLGGGISYM